MIQEKMRKLGRLVKEARKEQNLTQEQLAATTGVGLRFIRELEQGKESCHIGKVMMVMVMLGLELHVNGSKL